MRHSKLAIVLIAAVALGVIPACGSGHGGGGGNGYSVANNPLFIGSPAFPSGLVAGDHVEWAIPLSGGCGGPYDIEIVAGQLPEGLEVDTTAGEFWTDLNNNDVYDPGEPYREGEGAWNNGVYDADYPRHHIVGIAMGEDTYSFSIRIDDTGCSPFSSQVIDVDWTIGDGPLAIVGANPPLIEQPGYGFGPRGEPLPEWEDIAGLPDTVFGSTIAFNLIAVGGAAPYSCELIDDPNDPDDSGTLPSGVSMPAQSCALVGRPIQVGPNGKPWRFTFRVTDANGEQAIRKIQWRIATPALIFATDSMPDGVAGSPYTATMAVAEGVPPFLFELVRGIPSPNDNLDSSWVYASPNAPVLPGANAPTLTPSGNAIAADKISRTDYPAASNPGPDYTATGAPSEGMFFDDTPFDPGVFSGIPRRVGDFQVHVHAYSQSIPNERGQHAFGSLTFTIAPAPAFAITPSTFVEDALTSTLPDGQPTLAEFEVGAGVANDRVLAATGGVAMDGWQDDPHISDRLTDPTETVPAPHYTWSVSDWDPLNEGWHDPANPGFAVGQPIDISIVGADVMTAANSGNDLVRQSRQVIELTVADEQLPTTLTNIVTQRAGISIGPDQVIVTVSDIGASTTTFSTNNTTMHDDQVFIRQWDLVQGSGGVKDLTDANLTAGTVFPAAAGLTTTNNLGTLLSGTGSTGSGFNPQSVDILRVVINPSGWWDDMFSLHPKGGRAMQHTDPNQPRSNYGMGFYSYGWHASMSCLELPEAPNVTHAPASGIFADGGRMYAFDTGTHFGVFTIRSDASIYVPFAYKKDTTYAGFGDGMLDTRTSTAGSYGFARNVNIAISPDGRFAAMKLKRNPTTYNESGTLSGIVIFDLTGQQPFGASDAHYKIIGTGASSLTYAGADIFAGTTMVMTNQRLYFIIKHTFNSSLNTTPPFSDDTHWNNHHVMTYDILGAGTSAVLATSTDAAWTQTAATPMQTPGQLWRPLNLSTSNGWDRNWVSPESHMYGGMNLLENSLAPMPFRVNAAGTHCALLAASRATSVTSTSDPMNFYCWVDTGTGSFKRVTSVRRKVPQGGQRIGALHIGPASSYRHWGYYDGPSTGFEISDDGSKIAFAYQTFGTWSSSTTSTFGGIHQQYGHFNRFRQNVLVTKSTSGTSWPGFTENEVTRNTFGGTHLWKFGCLTFSPKNDKLFFYAGASNGDTDTTSDGSFSIFSTSTSYSYYSWDQWSWQKRGSFYVFDTSDAVGSEEVKNVFASADGGHGSAGTLYTGTTTGRFNPTDPSSTYQTNWGYLQPRGGFMSENRQFLYLYNKNILTTSGNGSNTGGMLVGINLTDQAVNGHAAETGFRLGKWPNRRSFLVDYPGGYSRYSAWSTQGYYDPAKGASGGKQVMVAGTSASDPNRGVVYFSTTSYRNGTSSSVYTGNRYSGDRIRGPWSGNGYEGGDVNAFSSNVGGEVARLTHPTINDPAVNLGATSSYPSGNSNYRRVHFLKTTRDGRRVAYVYDANYGSSSVHYGQEGIGLINNLQFSATTGALHSGFNGTRNCVMLEGNHGGLTGLVGQSLGRAGDAMAFDSQGTTLYYAFGSGNENAKTLKGVKVGDDGTAPTSDEAYGWATAKRYNVLFAAR